LKGSFEVRGSRFEANDEFSRLSEHRGWKQEKKKKKKAFHAITVLTEGIPGSAHDIPCAEGVTDGPPLGSIRRFDRET
jgi:hypothetical protein